MMGAVWKSVFFTFEEKNIDVYTIKIYVHIKRHNEKGIFIFGMISFIDIVLNSMLNINYIKQWKFQIEFQLIANFSKSDQTFQFFMRGEFLNYSEKL